LPPVQSLIASLINDITAAAAALTLVLDDYHLITSTSVHQALQLLLERQPPLMHVVISTREDPPLPLPQLRARGQVTEIRERDLRFTAEEADAFLNQTMGLSLSPGAVKALESRTEGWIAGLQLAALALQKDPGEAEAFIATFTGDNRYITDYLGAEVLQRQPEATRDFLRQTAILDRLTGPLCDAVTGREDSQAVLEQLEGANLFLIPLDHRREWYRYHHLFAEFLRTTLDQEEQTLLHQRATRWYETHGFPSQAIQHALAYGSTSGDWEDAKRLIRLAAEETTFSGGVLTVRGWLDCLPDERVRADGELATYKGWVLALTGDLHLAKEYADAADTRLRRTEAPTVSLGKLLALRSFIAVFGRQDHEGAIELAAGALQALKEDQPHWRKVLAITPEGEIAYTYHKARPSPAEHIPETEGKLLAVNTRYGRISTAICYDMFFSDLIRQAGKQQVDILLVPADEPMPELDPFDTESAMFCGIENGCSVLRSTLEGLTMGVDYQGNVLSRMSFWTTTENRTTITHVPTRGVRTLYALAGDWFAYAAILFTIGTIVWAVCQRVGQKRG